MVESRCYDKRKFTKRCNRKNGSKRKRHFERNLRKIRNDQEFVEYCLDAQAEIVEALRHRMCLAPDLFKKLFPNCTEEVTGESWGIFYDIDGLPVGGPAVKRYVYEVPDSTVLYSETF